MHRLNLVYVANQSQMDERALVSVALKIEFWKIKPEEKRALKLVVFQEKHLVWLNTLHEKHPFKNGHKMVTKLK